MLALEYVRIAAARVHGIFVVGLPLPAEGLRRLALDEALTDSLLRVCHVSDSASCLVRILPDDNIRPVQARESEELGV
jgi:hypothetical protein